jgi:hypothetical protein
VKFYERVPYSRGVLTGLLAWFLPVTLLEFIFPRPRPLDAQLLFLAVLSAFSVWYFRALILHVDDDVVFEEALRFKTSELARLWALAIPAILFVWTTLTTSSWVVVSSAVAFLVISTLLFFAPFTIILDDDSLVHAVQDSTVIVTGHFFHTLKVIFVLLLVELLAVTLGATVSYGASLFTMQDLFATSFWSVMNNIAYVLLAPYAVAYAYSHYERITTV